MKRTIISAVKQLDTKLGGYVHLMVYRYMNLCVKAEEGSLIPVVVETEDGDQKLEDVASIARQDDYTFLILADYDEDMPYIAKAINKVHPEFKQSYKETEVEVDDKGTKRRVRYLEVTMPEVNSDRRDALKQAVDTLYDECKAQMTAAIAEANAKLAVETAGLDEQELQDLKSDIKAMEDGWQKLRDDNHDKKLKEIEEGYQKSEELRVKS